MKQEWSRAIRYSTVWEDADVLCAALAPVAANGRLLSIASAGDNALALLTLDAAEVVALDYNPAQIACLELWLAAFRSLEHGPLLGFLGVSVNLRRMNTYRRLRGQLTLESRAYWDAHPREIATGIIHVGRLERYLRLFRRSVLPLIHSRGTTARLLEPRSRDEREAFYDRIWDTPRWRLLSRLFFSRAVMSRLGRDPAFFAHAEGSPGAALLARTRAALVEQAPGTNPFLAYILTGTYPPDALPRYLQLQHFETVRQRLDRLRLVCGDLKGFLAVDAAGFDGYNLSDVFEYLSPAGHEALYRAVVDRARPGARLAYWNMHVPRGLPDNCAREARSLRETADDLHRKDRVWFYRALHVDEVAPAQRPLESAPMAGAGV